MTAETYTERHARYRSAALKLMLTRAIAQPCGFAVRTFRELENGGLIEKDCVFAAPDHKKSRMQVYRLTDVGRAQAKALP